MSGFLDKRTSEAPEQPGQAEQIMTWHASLAMLPLVGQIARDIVRHHGQLRPLRPELADLERKRLQLAWPQRSRRYQVEEEIATLEGRMRDATAELTALGVALLDAATGLVGFPTLVNQRRAYFTWIPDESGLSFWSYVGERARRPVPQEWTQPENEPRARPRSRPRKK